MSQIGTMSATPIEAVEEPVDALRDEEGQDLAEYAILVGLIALAVVGAVTTFGVELVTFYQDKIVANLPF